MLNDKFKEIDVWAIISMKQVVKAIDPMMKTIAKFIDIVSKVATLTIITGYDNNGKPKFEKVSPDIFKNAAIAVSEGFGKFLTELATGFKALDDVGSYTIKRIGKALKPVIDVVSKFVDTVIKVSTMTYIDRYDSNGNPHYTQIDPKVFGTAAEVVSTSFGTFLTTLSENMKKLDYSSRIAMNSVKDAIAPVMEGISKFVDSIIKLSSAEVLDGYDANGKPKYRLIKFDDYIFAAGTICSAFSIFLESLSENLKSDKFGRS